MPHPSLTLRAINARAVLLKLDRPVVAKIATITHWPMILIDLTTEEGIVGRSYLEPYAAQSMKYLVRGAARSRRSPEGPNAVARRTVQPRAQVAALCRL